MKNLLTGTIVLTLLVGCQSGPTVEDVQVASDRQQRVLQQTISQLRKGLDEVRSQRDEVQTDYHQASNELETAQKSLQVTTARMRAERERAESSTKEVSALTRELDKTKRNLKSTKDRAGKLERELTSVRVALETDQSLVDKLNKREVKLQREIVALKEKFERHETSWSAERRGFQEKLQSRDDEIAVLKERISDGEGSAIAKSPSRSEKTSTVESNDVSDLPRGRREYYDTPPPQPKPVAPAQETVAVTQATKTEPIKSTPNQPDRSSSSVVAKRSDVGESTDPTIANENEASSESAPGFMNQVTEAWTFAVAQFQHFMQDPGKNYSSLLHPIPIGVILIGLLVPFLMLRFARRGRRRAKRAMKAANAKGRVSVQSTQVASPPLRSVANSRPSTTRVDENSQIADSFESSSDPLSPSNVGNIAATLDKVLGGDPISAEGSAETSASGKKPDEDDLLGDLKDIVSKGLS